MLRLTDMHVIMLGNMLGNLLTMLGNMHLNRLGNMHLNMLGNMLGNLHVNMVGNMHVDIGNMQGTMFSSILAG